MGEPGDAGRFRRWSETSVKAEGEIGVGRRFTTPWKEE